MTFSGKPASVNQLDTPGPKAKLALRRDREVVSHAYYREHPLVIAHGNGTVITDVDGNSYLDFSSGSTAHSVGYCHPQVVAAMQTQNTQLLQSSAHFYNEPWVKLSEELVAIAPFQEGAKSYLCSSPVEAKEMAMKVAAYHTGRKHFIEFISSSPYTEEDVASPPMTHRAPTSLNRITPMPFPNPYRPLFVPRHDSEDLGHRFVDYLEHVILRSTAAAEEVAGIVIEPIHQESGNVVPPPSFLPALRSFCDRYGILLIADEETSGMGRTGHWWAVDHWDVEPDIICIAKGTAGGMPIGGLLIRSGLDKLPPNLYGNIFGGHPITCVAALATLNVLREEGIANALQEGLYLQETLNLMMRHHQTIGQVRGKGLLIGLEFVWDRERRSPAPGLRNRVNQRCFEHGLILASCGENTLQLLPPLTVTRAEIDEALTIFEYALAVAEAELVRN